MYIVKIGTTQTHNVQWTRVHPFVSQLRNFDRITAVFLFRAIRKGLDFSVQISYNIFTSLGGRVVQRNSSRTRDRLKCLLLARLFYVKGGM